jgi:bifunctional ADP-heptose synthase (sugar kinase/adenylyltransferase)
MTLEEAVTAVLEHRKKSRTIVLANGAFDLLHGGHVR